MLDNETASPPETAAASPVAATGSVRRFYAYKLLTETQFTGGIWILYLSHKGFSLGQIGLAESAFHLAPVLLEIPSGSFADLVGRRWSLAIGALLIALSSAMIFVADSLPLMMLAMFANGASYSFRSGADQAYLYDSLGDRQGSFAGILGKLMGASYILAGATIWIGAALSDVSWGWPWALAVGVGLAAAWIAAGLREPQVPGEQERHSSPLRHLRAVAAALRARPTVLAMLLYSAGFWTVETIVFLYLQAVFSDRGLSNTAIGLVLGLTYACNALGSALAGRVEARGRFSRQVVVFGLLSGLSIAGIVLEPIWVAVAFYLVTNLVTGLFEPLLFAWFNRQLPSAQRATLLSFDSWLFSVSMIVLFPLGGWLADGYGWTPLILLAGGTKIVLTLLVVIGLRARGSGAAAARAA